MCLSVALGMGNEHRTKDIERTPWNLK